MANLNLSSPPVTRRTLVTGATAGIGFETARQLARRGHRVWVHGRTPESAARAVETLLAEMPDAALEAVSADLGSLAQTATLARALSEQDLDTVVHNAGVWLNRRTVTPDGFETTWAVNHLAPFLLTSVLLDRLCARPEARVITVSSMGHRSGRIHFDDLGFADRYDALTAYCQSKLANVLFTQELSRRTRGTSLVATSLHPGIVQTKLLGAAGFGTPAAVSPEDGARTTVFLATAPVSQTPTGGYFVDARLVAPATRDETLAARLWERSARQVAAYSTRPA